MSNAGTYNSQRLTARRSAILDVVRQEIMSNGFEDVTMNAIAEQAGVAKKTLYNLYGGRDELLLAAVEEIVSEYLNIPSEVAEGVAAIVQGRRTAIATVADNPMYAIAMLQSLVRVPQDHGLVTALLSNAVRFTQTQLAVELHNGGLRSTAIEPLARAIVGQGFGAILLLGKGLIAPSDIAEVSLRGLLAMLDSETIGKTHQWVHRQLQQI